MARMSWQIINDRAAWDNALCQLPNPHVLQSWAWGELKSRWGWRPERWRLDDDQGNPRAMLQLLRRKVGPLSVLYAPKGPCARDLAAYEDALAFVERKAKHPLVVWAKVDGDPFYDDSPPRMDDVRARLRERGWAYSAQQVQFRNTMFTSLNCSDDDLLKQMKEKTRYNVRLAERRGVVVRCATEADYETLYAMYAETGQRDGFVIREAAYYFDVWRTMSAIPLLAEREGQPLAGVILLCFANRAWYFYGMSKTEGREHMPTFALQYHAMRWARDNGYAIYDWWGAPDKLDETDSMWGVYRWKQGFGAEFVEGIGAWDFAPNKLLGKMANRVGG